MTGSTKIKNPTKQMYNRVTLAKNKSVFLHEKTLKEFDSLETHHWLQFNINLQNQ